MHIQFFWMSKCLVIFEEQTALWSHKDKVASVFPFTVSGLDSLFPFSYPFINVKFYMVICSDSFLKQLDFFSKEKNTSLQSPRLAYLPSLICGFSVFMIIHFCAWEFKFISFAQFVFIKVLYSCLLQQIIHLYKLYVHSAVLFSMWDKVGSS